MRVPRWVRRNAVALGVLVLVVPVTGVLVFGLQWADYESRIPSAVSVDRGEEVGFGGQRWRLDRTGEFEGTGEEGNGIPRGSSIVAALVTVTPDMAADAEIVCRFRLVQGPDREHPEGRVWAQLTLPASYRYGLGEETSPYCDPERGETYQLELVFLVPEGVYGDAVIEVETGSRRDRVLRMPMAG